MRLHGALLALLVQRHKKLTQKARLGLEQSKPEAHAAIWDGKGISFRAAQRGCTVDAMSVRISAGVVVKGVSICTFVPVMEVN